MITLNKQCVLDKRLILQQAEEAQIQPHGTEAVSMRRVQQVVLSDGELKNAQDYPFRRETVYM